MTKEIVSMRMTIRDINNVILAQMTVYGAKIGNRTIFAEGRYFRAGRKAGFGKSAYICENTNGQWHKVVIDRIENVA
jgi:hypothetical protein